MHVFILIMHSWGAACSRGLSEFVADLGQILLMLEFEAVGAVGIAASFESGARWVRIERPGQYDFPVFLFRGDEPVGRLAMLDPIHDH